MKWQEMKPVRKVELPAFAGSATVIITWIVEASSSLEVPAAVASAITVVVMAIVGWLAPRG